jgi:hypothetical protein
MPPPPMDDDDLLLRLRAAVEEVDQMRERLRTTAERSRVVVLRARLRELLRPPEARRRPNTRKGAGTP